MKKIKTGYMKEILVRKMDESDKTQKGEGKMAYIEID